MSATSIIGCGRLVEWTGPWRWVPSDGGIPPMGGFADGRGGGCLAIDQGLDQYVNKSESGAMGNTTRFFVL